MSELIYSLILDSAARTPTAEALADRGRRLDYAALAATVERAAGAFAALGLGRGERVGVYLEKSVENVAAMFGAAAAGGVFVPVNPLLKAAQVGHILRDCDVRILVTSPDRVRMLEAELATCPAVRVVIVTGSAEGSVLSPPVIGWDQALELAGAAPVQRVIDADMAAILYTSGSTGKPKGVVLSHRNLVLGAVAIFLYVGGEVSIGSFLINYLGEGSVAGLTPAVAAHYVSYYWGGAMIGRFAGFAVMRKVSPGKTLAFNAGCVTLLVLVAIFVQGHVAMWAILAVGLFNSIMFPTIFSMALHQLGKLTGQASGVLCMAIVGGALVPFAQGILADSIGLNLSFLVPAACYIFILYFGLKYANMYRALPDER